MYICVIDSNWLIDESSGLKLDWFVAIKNLFSIKKSNILSKISFTIRFSHGHEICKEVRLFQIYTHNTPTVTLLQIYNGIGRH